MKFHHKKNGRVIPPGDRSPLSGARSTVYMGCALLFENHEGWFHVKSTGLNVDVRSQPIPRQLHRYETEAKKLRHGAVAQNWTSLIQAATNHCTEYARRSVTFATFRAGVSSLDYLPFTEANERAIVAAGAAAWAEFLDVDLKRFQQFQPDLLSEIEPPSIYLYCIDRTRRETEEQPYQPAQWKVGITTKGPEGRQQSHQTGLADSYDKKSLRRDFCENVQTLREMERWIIRETSTMRRQGAGSETWHSDLRTAARIYDSAKLRFLHSIKPR